MGEELEHPEEKRHLAYLCKYLKWYLRYEAPLK